MNGRIVHRLRERDSPSIGGKGGEKAQALVHDPAWGSQWRPTTRISSARAEQQQQQQEVMEE